jgi:triosephosphate isomerase (TIM)
LRKKIFAGNWKMHKAREDAVALVESLVKYIGNYENADMVLCPPFTNLDAAHNIVVGSNIELGAQNMYFELQGAYTGEISAEMLKSVGCEYVIIGHSERRQYFGETNETVNKKIKVALENYLIPIMCVGEKLEEREQNSTFEVIAQQLSEGLVDLGAEVVEQSKEIIIAYEPIWAIGTGKVATPEQAQEVHAFIRTKLTEIFGEKRAQEIRLQYGGSVKPENVKELMEQPDIDGALIGGAALKADSFAKIVKYQD